MKYYSRYLGYLSGQRSLTLDGLLSGVSHSLFLMPTYLVLMTDIMLLKIICLIPLFILSVASKPLMLNILYQIFYGRYNFPPILFSVQLSFPLLTLLQCLCTCFPSAWNAVPACLHLVTFQFQRSITSLASLTKLNTLTLHDIIAAMSLVTVASLLVSLDDFINICFPIQMVSKSRAEVVSIFVYHLQPQHMVGNQ